MRGTHVMMWKGLCCRGESTNLRSEVLPHQGETAKERKWKEGHTGYVTGVILWVVGMEEWVIKDMRGTAYFHIFPIYFCDLLRFWGLNPGNMKMLDKCPITELHPQPFVF
jgi:hypothetical protein